MVRSIFTPLARSVIVFVLAICAHQALAQSSWTIPEIENATISILDQDFSEGINRYDGHTGIWSTRSPRGSLMTNAEESVFLDPNFYLDANKSNPEWKHVPPTMKITQDGLSIRTIALPEQTLAPIKDHLKKTGQGARADKVRYATGRIATVETWAQTYGWFEIDARIPRGKGRWPAFWLNFAGPGWPPEIDIFEAYGAGIAASTPKDGRFNTAVLFDNLDASKQPVHSVDIVNPYDENSTPRVKKRGGRDIYTFARNHFEANIYDRVNTYAALWTPNEIIFYFGPDRENLEEIYRAPTPEDAHDPMYLIANDQFTARGGSWSADAALDAVLDPKNDFLISAIRVRAWRPDLVLDMSKSSSAFDPRSSIIRDTSANDIISPNDGFDIIELSGGADEIRVRRGRENKVIIGFDGDDVLSIDGFPFVDSADAHSRLTQVGQDVWLSSGADPFWPQSVVFRDTTIDEIRPDQIVSRWPIGRDIWATRLDLKNSSETDADRDGVIAAPESGGWLNDKGKVVQMVGGPGPERYLVSHPNTRIQEPKNGNIDTLFAWGRRDLPTNVERGILRGKNGKLKGTSGDDRLEAEGEAGQLSGEAGNDLYIISERASDTKIHIQDAPGHDRIRGIRSKHNLVISPALRANHADWQIQENDEGVLIIFNDKQSLLIEGINMDNIPDVEDLK